MYRDGKIHIPVSLFAMPFVGLFKLVGLILKVVLSVVTLGFLASGAGTLIAAATGGFGRKVKVLDYEEKTDDNAKGRSALAVGRIKYEERPGWALRALGARTRQRELFARNPEDPMGRFSYFTAENQAVSKRKRAKIQRALEGHNVMKQFNV